MNPQSLFDSYYTYEPPLTFHEITMIFFCLVAAVTIIVGICLLYGASHNYGSYSETNPSWMLESDSNINMTRPAIQPITQPTTQKNELLQNGGWKCACGRVNPSYTGTCACGRRKNGTNSAGEKKQVVNQTRTATNTDTKFEEIKKYKDLLDSGIITEEEFNKKKTELLGL